jgi:hypothetical protein
MGERITGTTMSNQGIPRMKKVAAIFFIIFYCRTDFIRGVSGSDITDLSMQRNLTGNH